MLCGLLLAMAFPNINFAGAAWVAPGLILSCAYGKRGGAAWWIGYAAGLAFWLASLRWLLEIPVVGYPILGWIALAAFLAVFPATWVWLLAGKVGRGSWLRRCFWAMVGAAIWVTLEMIRARLFGGFPWIPIGVSQWQMVPLIQIAATTGVYGVSFLVIWLSLAMYSGILALFRHPTTRYVWLGEVTLPAVVLMLSFNHGLARLRDVAASDNSRELTFVQPAVPQNMIWDEAENTNRFNQLLSLTEQALSQKTQILLWPEAALPDLNDESFAAISKLVRSHNTWMIFCADDYVQKENPTPKASYDVFNAAFALAPNGTLAATYHKQELVIFGEYIPLLDYLPFIRWFTPINAGYAKGKTRTQFECAEVRLSPLICFEDTFPHQVRAHVTRDTDLIVNLTNDGWFGNSAAQWQHAATAAFRTVENGIPMVRCCNNGITTWIDAQGRVREIFRTRSGSEYEAGADTWRIDFLSAGKRATTAYNRYGDRFGWTCVGITTVVVLWRLKRYTKRRFRRATVPAATSLDSAHAYPNRAPNHPTSND